MKKTKKILQAFIFSVLTIAIGGGAAPLHADPVIVDNADAAFSTVGAWNVTYKAIGFYGADYAYAYAGDGSSTATFTFQIPTSGNYEIAAQWPAHSSRAPDAPFTLINNGTTVDTIRVNQQVDGGQFNPLTGSNSSGAGIYALTAGVLEVTLSNDAAGKVAADAVRVTDMGATGNQAPDSVIDTPAGGVTNILVGQTVNFTGTGSDPEDGSSNLTYLWQFGSGSGIADSNVQDPGTVQFDNAGVFTVSFTVTDSQGLADPTPAQVTINVSTGGTTQDPVIVDNADAAFSTVGAWNVTYKAIGFYGADYAYAYAGDGSSTATFTFQIPTSGNYEIAAQWPAHSSRAPDAPFTLINNGTTVDTIRVNQQVDGGQFNPLTGSNSSGAGIYALTAGVLEVTLSNDAAGKVAADAVRVAPGGLKIVSPTNTDFLTSRDITVQASYSGFPSDWDIEFTLDGDTANPLPSEACVPAKPDARCVQLTNLSYDEHMINAYMIDQNGVPQPYEDAVSFVIGFYYVGFGDSVTRGSHDDIAADDVSNDGRDSGGGYEPILNNLLSNATGFPHTVKNEGISGNLSSDGVNRIAATLAAHPNANYFLIMFGTNDAKNAPPVSTANFQNNMQQIIDAVVAAGKAPYLAKIPYMLGSSSTGPQFTDPDNAAENLLIIEYNQIIDQLAANNGIPVTPPDFYNYFRDNYFFDGASEYGDNIHPNGLGYQGMADMWAMAILP